MQDQGQVDFLVDDGAVKQEGEGAEEDGAGGEAGAGAGTGAGGGKAVDKSQRITTRYMTKYERARILGTRALQLRCARRAAAGGGA